MKIIAYIVALALVALPASAAEKKSPVPKAASPSSPAAPSKLSREDQLELQVIALQLDRIQHAAEDAAKGILARRAELLKKYGLDEKLSDGASIDADGVIHRKAPEPAKPAPAKK